MAEKSKRVTTPAPRTRDPKASKSSKKAAKEAKPKTTAKKATAATKKSQATKAAPSVTTTAPEAPLAAEAPAVSETQVTTEAKIAAEPTAAETPATAEANATAEAPVKATKTAKATTTTKKKKSADAEAKPSPKKSKKATASPDLPVETAPTEATPVIEAPGEIASAPSVSASTASAPLAAPIEVSTSSAVAVKEPKSAVPAPAARASRSTKKKAVKKKAAKSSAATRASSLPLKQYEFIGVPSFKGQAIEERPAVPAPPPPSPKQLTLEERLEILQARLAQQGEAVRRQIQEQLDMSWIYHDSALEGVVYSFQELKTALGPDQTLVQESNLQPVIDEIRRHRAAIELVRECAKKKTPITLDLIKRIYLTLHPEEGDLKTVKYRKDIPQHRLYFHEYAAPDKIAGKVRQVVDWLNEPEAQKGRNALRVAARAHYDLLRAFPFQTDSGKVARLLMNLLLLQSGYEPAILHSTERQRYYDALKGSAPTIISMVVEAEENAVMSLEKLLDELELRGRGYAG